MLWYLQAIVRCWWWVFNPQGDRQDREQGIIAVTLEQSWFSSSGCALHWRAALLPCFVWQQQHGDPPASKQKFSFLKCHFLSLSTRFYFVLQKGEPQISSSEYLFSQGSVYLSQELENGLFDSGWHEWSVWWNVLSTCAVAFSPFHSPP